MNQIPNWIHRKSFSTSLTKSPICVSTGCISPVCNIVINFIVDDRACVGRLHYAKDISASKSKACLPRTRVALLEGSESYQSACASISWCSGKRKVSHCARVSRCCCGAILCIRKTASCRSSFLFGPSSLLSLLPKQLQSSDILAQHDLVVKGLASIDDKTPPIYTIDALDECPASAEDADALSVYCGNCSRVQTFFVPSAFFSHSAWTKVSSVHSAISLPQASPVQISIPLSNYNLLGLTLNI
jgi:hypothetical protein